MSLGIVFNPCDHKNVRTAFCSLVHCNNRAAILEKKLSLLMELCAVVDHISRRAQVRLTQLLIASSETTFVGSNTGTAVLLTVPCTVISLAP